MVKAKTLEQHKQARNDSPSQVWVCQCGAMYVYGQDHLMMSMLHEDVEDESGQNVVLLRHKICGRPLVLYNRG